MQITREGSNSFLEMKNICLIIVLVLLIICTHDVDSECSVNSLTTASGTKARSGPICSGDLIFEENFDRLDLG